METLAVLVKVKGGSHEDLHVFEDGGRSGGDVIPCSLQSVDWSCTEGRDNRSQCGKVVQLSAFLERKKKYSS